MAKMSFEALITELEKGTTWPGTTMARYVIQSDDLKKYGMQKKRGETGSHCAIWALGIGEIGQQLTYFYGHRPLDAAKKAYEWKSGSTPQEG